MTNSKEILKDENNKLIEEKISFTNTAYIDSIISKSVLI